MSKLLSIIISNRNDTVMLNLTIRSCIEELRPIGLKNCEIVICDNSDPEYVPVVKSVIPEKYLNEGLVKLIYQPFPCLFTARESAISAATGTYIMCLDSHMLMGRNAISNTLKFAEDKSSDSTLAFIHPPLCWAHQHGSMARHDRDMSIYSLGRWGSLYHSVRTITWKGMPWLCRKDFFVNSLRGYGALAENRLSWGGGDMHIGMKPWLLGFKNWAIPTNPIIHIGPYPAIEGVNKKVVVNHKGRQVRKSLDVGYAYRTYRTSGIYDNSLGHMTSAYVLGNEWLLLKIIPELIDTYKSSSSSKLNSLIPLAKKFGKSEREWLEKEQKLDYKTLLSIKPWDN